MSVIEARDLSKHYGGVRAVDGVSFDVSAGEIFGVLGPNGAGKTTLLEILEGLRQPDSGTATVLDGPMATNARALKQRIGVQLQATALPEYTKVAEAIDLFGAFYTRRRPTSELLAEFDLKEKASAYATKLSGGQMQRLSIALALVNSPELVFLDEPTTGLDPQARRALWAVIEAIRERGRTVVLTTHYMEEAEHLCDRIAVMDQGRIVALDTPSRLIAAHARGSFIEFNVGHGIGPVAFEAVPGVDGVTIRENRVSLATTTPETVLAQLFDPVVSRAWADPAKPGRIGVRDLAVHAATLEDVFINLTGRELRA